MCAVTGKQPSVMQSQNDRNVPAEARQRPKVKVTAMQIMAMYDVRILRHQFQQVPRPREVEILISASNVPEATRLTDALKQAVKPLRDTDSSGSWKQQILSSQTGLCPETTVHVILYLQYIGIITELPTHNKPRMVTALSVGMMQIPSNSLSATSDICGAHLCNPQASALSMN
jgi:hypothetical protein